MLVLLHPDIQGLRPQQGPPITEDIHRVRREQRRDIYDDIV